MFPLVSNNCRTEIRPMIVEHLSTLQDNLSYYFPLINTAQYYWIRNPVVETAIYSSLTLTEEEELSTVSTGRGLMIKYKELSVEAIRISIKEEHVSTSKKELAFLLQFSASYSCELGLSTLATMKCVKRETLQCIDEEMRVCFSNIRPNMEEIARRSHQTHVSH